MMGKLKKAIKKFPVLKARLKHLEAYDLMIKKKTSTAKRVLNTAIKSAQSDHNYLELHWAEHSRASWFLQNNHHYAFFCLPIHDNRQ